MTPEEGNVRREETEPSRLERIILDLKTKLGDNIGVVVMFQGDAEHLVEAYYNYITDPSNACWMCSGSNCELQGLCGTHACQVIEEKNRENTRLKAVNAQHVSRIIEAYAALGIELEDGAFVTSLGDHITILLEELGETKAALELCRERIQALENPPPMKC